MPEFLRPFLPEDRLVLLPKNPGTFFIFWQFSGGRADSFRMAAFSPEIELRLYCAGDKTPASSQNAPWQAGRAYLSAPECGGDCEAALYALRNGAWEKLLDSNKAAAPAAGMADDRDCASLEFHKKALS